MDTFCCIYRNRAILSELNCACIPAWFKPVIASGYIYLNCTTPFLFCCFHSCSDQMMIYNCFQCDYSTSSCFKRTNMLTKAKFLRSLTGTFSVLSFFSMFINSEDINSSFPHSCLHSKKNFHFSLQKSFSPVGFFFFCLFLLFVGLHLVGWFWDMASLEWEYFTVFISSLSGRHHTSIAASKQHCSGII